MMRNFGLIFVSTLGAASPALGQANLRDDCPMEIYESAREEGIIAHCSIIVIGNLPTYRGERTENITKVQPSDLIALRVEQSLSEIPGLQQFRRSDARSANPTSQGVTLRGLGGNASSRALLFLDDVPQADPFGSWVSWPSYDALNLASIRVRKGGGHASAGPGALSGVIEFDSLQGRKVANAALSYGSRNSIEARGRFSSGLGNGYITASGSYARGDGFVPIIASQRGIVDRRANYEQAGLALRMHNYLSDSVQLQANLRAFTDDRNRGLDFSDNRNNGVDASVRLVKREGDWQWSTTAYLQIREFSSQFGAVSADRSTVTPTLDQFATPSTGLGVRFEVRPPVGDKAELRLGGEWRRTIGETRENFTFVSGLPTRFRTAGGQTDSYGVFLEGSVEPADGLTLSGGGRVDRWQIQDGFRREVNIGGTVRSDDRFANRNDVEGTARAGLGWEITNSLTLRGSGYVGWRLPTLNELYRPFRVGADATAANEALRPERIKGVEGTVSFQDPDESSNSASLSLFYNRLDNAIANVTRGQGPGLFPGVGFVAAGGTYRQRQNLDAIFSKGVELDGRVALTDDLSAHVGYAYVDAKVRGTGLAASLNGLRPAQVPQHFANGGIDYSGDSVQAGFALRYLGSQFEDDANSRRLGEALTADAHLGYRFDNCLSLELRGENLLNARVEAAISGAGVIERASPRTIWFGVRWNFD